MLNERTIISGLILLAGLILGPYLIVLTLEINRVFFLASVGAVFLFCIFCFVGDRIAVAPVLCGFLAGSLNFLPFGLTAHEIGCIVLIIYYLITYVALKKRAISGGPIYFSAPILVIALIVMYQNRQVGLHIFGGLQEGSRPGLLILLASMAYFCGINIPSPSKVFFSRFPWYCFFVACAGAIPFLLTTYFPSLAPYLFQVSSNVNVDAYKESLDVVGQSAGGIGRNGSLAGLGGFLEITLIAYYPINTWWRPERWFLPIFSIFCFAMVLMGGYRNGLVLFSLSVLLGVVSYGPWRLFVILPFVGFVVLGLEMVQELHPMGITLPEKVQRSMSFLPGKWDMDVAESALSSNDFRANIQRVYMLEYFRKSPWIGNGFTFDTKEEEELQNLADKSDTPDHYYQAKAFIISKTFHIGWISLYDAVGIIGGAAFIVLEVTMLWISMLFVFGRNVDRRSSLFPLKVWTFCGLASSAFGYFVTFGSFPGAVSGLYATAIILVHIKKIDQIKIGESTPRQT